MDAPALLRGPRNCPSRVGSWLALLISVVSWTAAPGAPAPSELVNISVRTNVGSGDAALIAGFVITGSGTRPLLVRAVGPTLAAAPFNVPGTVLDPQVKVYLNGTSVFSNDDWGNDAALAAQFSRLGAFPLRANSRDSALIALVGAGTYTAVASGKTASDNGDLLLELYDARTGAGAVPAINNLSLRAELPAAGLMITGFVVSGTEPKRLLVRAIGPTLAGFGIDGALPDPRIRLFTGSTDVAVNDDWNHSDDAENIADTARNVGAFALSRDSKDAAIVTTLQPGAYTLQVTSTDATATGIVLVEIYNADPALAPPTTPPPAPDANLPQVLIYSDDPDASESGDTGHIIVHRNGSTADPLTVKLQWSGTATPGVDYITPPTQVSIPAGSSDAGFLITPISDTLLEAPESAIASVVADPAYTIGTYQDAGVLIADGPYTGPAGWKGEYFNNNTLSGAPTLTRTDPAIDFTWTAKPATTINAYNFSVRWSGVIIPPSTEEYTFILNADDAAKLTIDGQVIINRPDYDWRETGASVLLAGGVPHFVTLEFIQYWGDALAKLEWSAPGMTRHTLTEVAAPVPTPPAALGLDRTVALVGEPFYAFIESTGMPTSFTAAGLPPGLAINTQSGVISGTATAAGDYAVWLGATNTNGSGSTVTVLSVLDPGGAATREVFAGPPSGLTIPAGTPPTSVTTFSTLDLTTTDGPFVERLRGYITAPLSGVYRFWIAASGPAEFRFADSEEPGDTVGRARVVNSTAPREWTRESGQVSPQLSLEAGKRYYFEVVHAQSGANGYVSLGWQKPGQVGVTPFGIVPNFTLSAYVPEAPIADGSTIYLTNLRPPTAVKSSGSGVASLVLSPDQTTAHISLSLSGLSSDATNIQLYYGGPADSGSTPLRALPRSAFEDFSWDIAAIGTLTPGDILSALTDGRLFIMVQTADNPAVEIRGQFGPALGSSEFQPPPAPPALPTGLPTETDAARLLNQATFGPRMEDVTHVQQIGVPAWITEQMALPYTQLNPFIVQERAKAQAKDPESDVYSDTLTESFWRNAVNAPDQLRQRVVFALGEIFVVSTESNVGQNVDALARYYDMLGGHAFGNFRDILHDVTLSPTMGVYLSMVRNQRPDPLRGIYPDENYAREVMQLFSIGLSKLHPDGTLILDSHGLPISTYSQDTIVGMAHVFTGWNFAPTPGQDYSYEWSPENFTAPMQQFADYHDDSPKRLLDSEVQPAGLGGQADLDHVLDMLFNHPNTGPFISRQLIQRLVTSNPSPAYVYRVARVFADNGQGVRGDMGAVIRAILTDWEARSPDAAAQQGYGKLREPLVRFAALWRAFHAASNDGSYNFAWTSDRIGQEILQSPTVFNYFQPDYIAPGATGSAGLVAPEFKIATDSNLASWVNTLDWFCDRSDPTTDVVLNVSAEQALVANPDAFLDRMNTLLFADSMPADLRAQMKTLLTGLPNWFDDSGRTRTVISTMVTSPDYVIQR